MYWRVTLALIVAVLLAGTHWKAYVSGKQAVQVAWDRDIAARTAAALKAEQEAREKESKLLAARQASEAKYVQEKRKAAAAAAAAGSELDRLRDELAAAPPGGKACSDPAAPGRADGRAGLERELLGHCAQALVGLASEADGLEARLVGLQQYVKNVCLK